MSNERMKLLQESIEKRYEALSLIASQKNAEFLKEVENVKSLRRKGDMITANKLEQHLAIQIQKLNQSIEKIVRGYTFVTILQSGKIISQSKFRRIVA